MNKAAADGVDNEVAEGMQVELEPSLQNRWCSRIITGLLGANSRRSEGTSVGPRFDRVETFFDSKPS
jgi:hypothetical protein